MLVLAQSSLSSSAVGWPVVLASLSLVILALALAAGFGLRIERELIVAAARAAAQLLAVGYLFAFIFQSTGASYWAWLWVGGMTIVASVVVVRRAKYRIRGLALVAASAVAGSALISIAVTFGFRVVDFGPVSLVVIAGITIGNAVPAAVLGVNRSVDSCRDRIDDLQALLSWYGPAANRPVHGAADGPDGADSSDRTDQGGWIDRSPRGHDRTPPGRGRPG